MSLGGILTTENMMARSNPYWKMANKTFDSKFEKALHEGVLAHCEFHTKEKVPYVVPKNYLPDFIWTSEKTGIKYYIEAKGRFEDNVESSKYKHIRDHLPAMHELVFLFQSPMLPMPRAKVRKKCGTKATHSEWSSKNGFQWFSKDTIKELFDEG